MSGNRRYSAQFKAEAVMQLVAAGYPKQRGVLIKVARELDVPDATLGDWFRNPAALTRRRSATRPAVVVGDAAEEVGARSIRSFSSPSERLAFFQQEMAQIEAELAAARRAASYKDLIVALRGLNGDIKQLEEMLNETNYDDEDITAQLLEAMDRFAPFVGTEEVSDDTETGFTEEAAL